MGIMWGTDEHLECITALPRKPDMEPIVIGGQKNVCIGFKYSVSWAGVPYRTTDDGYVLTVPDSKVYIPVDKDGLAALQADGLVSTPAPTYSIPSGWYYAQFSLYALLGLIALGIALKFWLRHRVSKRRATREVVTTGPVLAKLKDKSLSAMLTPMLGADEAISHQAYAHDRNARTVVDSAGTYEYFVALTNKRLIWITQKMGVFGMGRGDQTTGEIDRAIIERIVPDGNTLDIMRDNGPPMLTLHVPLTGSGYSFENQSAFLADLPRIVRAAAA